MNQKSFTRPAIFGAVLLLVLAATAPSAAAYESECPWCLPVLGAVLAGAAIYNEYCGDHGEGGICPGSNGGAGGNGGAGCSSDTIALGGCEGGQGGDGGEGTGYGDDGQDGEDGPPVGP